MDFYNDEDSCSSAQEETDSMDMKTFDALHVNVITSKESRAPESLLEYPSNDVKSANTAAINLHMDIDTLPMNASSEEMTSGSLHLLRDPLSSYLSQKAQLLNISPTSWRTRDPIYAILHKREMLQKLHLDTSVMTSTSMSTPLQPRKGKEFPIDELLAQCEDKRSVVHRAFDAAAFSVLRAVRKQKKRKDTNNKYMNGEFSEGAELPLILQALYQLDETKKNALEIVSHKRKGQPSAAAAKKTKVEEKKPKQKQKQNQKPSKKETPSVQLAGYSNLDSRSTVSRAILCAAASLTFKQLTPKFDHLEDINVLDIPQNPERNGEKSPWSHGTGDGKVDTNGNEARDTCKEKSDINMGAVTMSADIFAKRTCEHVNAAVNRSERRRRWRMDCARSDLLRKEIHMNLSKSNPVDRYLSWKNLNAVSESDTDDDDSSDDDGFGHYRNGSSQNVLPRTNDDEWTETCLPRLLTVMSSGSGHVVLHDLQWSSRADRVQQLLRGLATDDRFILDQGMPNFGPHLIITTGHDLDTFMSVLGKMTYTVLEPTSDIASFSLRGIRYHGNKRKRRRMRGKHFTSLGMSGLPDSPYNMIVTSYETFIQDYLHLCQIPFQAVVLDDGMSWLGTAHFDPNGQLGKVFDMAMWSKTDYHAGSAGVENKEWDFRADIASDGTIRSDKNEVIHPVSSTLIGLTARHRILLASSMHSRYKDVTYSAPVPALVSFLFPQFADAVKEEWDRSRMHACEKSMNHIRKLLCRSIVVYTGSRTTKDLVSHAISSMTGAREYNRSDDSYPLLLDDDARSISTDKMVSEGKIVQSRRLAASWLRSGSPIRLELGTIQLDPIVNIFKARLAEGCICEEIVTASSVTTNGAGGAVAGPSAYKTAVRCGRQFGSEQGLRQHIAALHAPPGTWLCRSCSVDCGTSQARTHHERTCAANISGNSGPIKENPLGGGLPSVGQISKKKRSGSNSKSSKDKDEHGNLRVPGYRGVWVSPKGNHIVKIDGKPLMQEGDEFNMSSTESTSECAIFESCAEAAKVYDIFVTKKREGAETNYKSDGTRNKYDETANSAVTGRGLEMLGGGASSVVPALSVINIKDLPKGVVPLLRDPKQTSRAGGNAKRHIYAYRGVCRQARKGHDRWQSQISFGGTNHYLGTFDSEWDAAAIYAWAHLILYGEEATKKAQEEGEEAVAAYEQEKKDIAEGKIIAPPPKKKKMSVKPKGTGQRGRRKKVVEPGAFDGQTSPLTADVIKPSIPKMALEFQKSRVAEYDSVLTSGAMDKIFASQSYDVIHGSRCISIGGLPSAEVPAGCAALVGLTADQCGWDVVDFANSIEHLLKNEREMFLSAVAIEWSNSSRFRSLMQRVPCFVGKAPAILDQAASTLGFYGREVGRTLGHVDCNIGGIASCSENACCISYSGSASSFMFKACGENDIVTLNGLQIKPSMGNFRIESGDICSVGARVFMFVLPSI